MIVTCEACAVAYDDVYCRTFCPHDGFPCSPSAAAALREVGIEPGDVYEEIDLSDLYAEIDTP